MALEYRIREPSDPSAPLLFLVHGRAGNKDVMWAFARSVPESWGIIAPQAPLSDPVGGYSWWLVDSPTRSQEIEQAATALRSFILEHAEARNAPIRIAAGFSQGAGLLSLLLQREPEFFKGVALLAGFVLKPTSVPDACNQQHARVFVGHGSLDETVSIQSAINGVEQLRAQGFSVEFHQDPVGHKVGSISMRAFKEFLRSLSAT